MRQAATIVIPSYKRAGRVKSAALFPDGWARVWVPESQVESYKALQPELRVEGIPDAADGRGMAHKRNFVLEHTQGPLVMVDDDVRELRRWEGNELRVLTQAEGAELLAMGVELSRAVGAGMWSPNIKADPRAYSKMRPFSLLSPVLGPWTGINRPLAEKLRYDTRFTAKEDYDLWLQAIYHFRRTLRLNQFCIIKKEEAVGGLARTYDDERAEARLIERKWGNVITYGNKKSVLDGTVHMPIAGC